MTSPERANLSPDEAKIYDLVCRRLLSCWHEDHVWSVTTVITAISNDAIIDRYHSSGKTIQQVGWKVLDLQEVSKANAAQQEEEQALPSGWRAGQAQDVLDAEAVRKKTRAPKRFTEATLLTAMETAGKTLDEKELSDAMKESGLGTPATRASIIEVLLKREYILRNGKNLEATDKGIQLIEVVHPEVKSPAMTGQWEAYLKRIQRGEAQLEPFLRGIEDYVREWWGRWGTLPAMRRGSGARPHVSRGRARWRPRRPVGARSWRTSRSNRCCIGLLVLRFPGESGRGLPDGDCGARCAAGDADGRGEIALLSIARVGARGNDAGDQSADCADGGSSTRSCGSAGSRWSAFTRGGTGRPRGRRVSII